jgi:acetolactate synthase-1/2/3 large subunit
VLTGYDLLLASLRDWGITVCAGVTGGGVIHLLKHLPPHGSAEDAISLDVPEVPSFFSLGEYAAGFVPLGHFMATGKPAAAVATTGAATKLLMCGLSDAKLHDIRAVYLVPVAGRSDDSLGRLQDTSIYGSNIVAQLIAEIPDAVIFLEDPASLSADLRHAGELVGQSRPVVLVFHPDVLSAPLEYESLPVEPILEAIKPAIELDTFIEAFHASLQGRRLVILAGEELCRYDIAPGLTTRLSKRFQAPLIWSINGANGVERDNPFGYGYVLFGGNDAAIEIWNSLGENDVLLVLGASLDEYTANLAELHVGACFFMTGLLNGYGTVDGSFGHRIQGDCFELHAPLDWAMMQILEHSGDLPLGNLPGIAAPANLNVGSYPRPADGCVDLVQLYQKLDAWWPLGSIGFDDVCLAYKDRQYVTQRPHPNIRFYSFYRGSAMGSAFGAAVGARLGSPDRSVFLFTGDGCFRLFAGCLGEARHLGIVMFVLNNGKYSIVAQGLNRILDDIDPVRHHADLDTLDHAAIARACGWNAHILRPDLSNLQFILEDAMRNQNRSVLIDVPVDGNQELGKNPRLRNL